MTAIRTSLHMNYVKSNLGGCAIWRGKLAEKYPDDIRLSVAADALQMLAKADAFEVPAHLRAKLEDYRGPEFTTAVREAAREVGYAHSVFTLTEFVELVLDKLAPVSNAEVV